MSSGTGKYHSGCCVALECQDALESEGYCARCLLYQTAVSYIPLRFETRKLSLTAYRVIPPSLTRLKYIEQVLHSTDWSYARIDVVIISQISMHVSVILATVPCIRPWLNAFESGGLQAPAEVRRQSRQLAPIAPKLAPLLPIAMTPPTSDEDMELTPGAAGHRKRVEAWPVQFWAGDSVENKTVTTVEVDRAEAKEMARKISLDSQSSRGITRTTSFSVKFEQKQQRPAQASKPPLSRSSSYNAGSWDVGGLLKEAPTAKLMLRTNSVVSI